MKELLLTTLATTISIVLTFGTADAVEQLKKEMSKMPSGMASRAVQGTNIDESGTRLQLNEPGWGSTNYRKVE